MEYTDGRPGGDAFAKHARDLGLTDRSISPLSVAPDGLFRGRRTKLPAGDAIDGGDSKYPKDRQDAPIAYDGTDGDAVTNMQRYLPYLFTIPPPARCRPRRIIPGATY